MDMEIKSDKRIKPSFRLQAQKICFTLLANQGGQAQTIEAYRRALVGDVACALKCQANPLREAQSEAALRSRARIRWV